MGTILDWRALDTGFCYASESDILQGGTHKKVKIHALVGLIRHSEQGWILFDTGYAPRMQAATQAWPYWLYRIATPFVTPIELALANQLGHFEIKPSDISHIIISHFHADHVAGLLDFPQARLVASAEAYAGVRQAAGLSALRRAFLPSLLPANFVARAKLIDKFRGQTLPGLGAAHDLFGDGSIVLVPLPGHARGQIGALLRTPKESVLFAADGAWYRRSIREMRPPARIARIFIDNWAALTATLVRLHLFAQAEPQTIIIPTHCPEVYDEYCR